MQVAKSIRQWSRQEGDIPWCGRARDRRAAHASRSVKTKLVSAPLSQRSKRRTACKSQNPLLDGPEMVYLGVAVVGVAELGTAMLGVPVLGVGALGTAVLHTQAARSKQNW